MIQIEHKGRRRWLGARPLRTGRATMRRLGRPLVLALVGLLGLLIGAPALVVRKVQIPRADNALVEIQGQTIGAAGGSATPTSPSQRLTFTVARQPAGTITGTVTVAGVPAGCGEWNTLVGGGPTAFWRRSDR